MKRSTLITVFTFALAFSSASTAKACCYIPWLDPFAWLGFYGCGYGCGGGYGGMGGGYCGGYGGYAAPAYTGYRAPVYSNYVAPQMTYPVAPTPGCNCNGGAPSAVPQVPQVPLMIQPQAMAPRMQAVRVPVTTYRAVTQYVPQTTYRTQYQYSAQPAVAAYAAPSYTANAYPAATYNTAMAPTQIPATSYYAPTTPAYSQPMIQTAPSIASPVPPGDIMGDHEYPTQSSIAPIIPNSHTGAVPVRAATYGVTPRGARTFPASIR